MKTDIEQWHLPTIAERMEIQRQAERDRAEFLRTSIVAGWNALRRLLAGRRETLPSGHPAR